MNRKYALVDLEPNIDTTPGTPHGGSDILFDWTPIEIPTGACSVKTVHAIVEGTDGAPVIRTIYTLFCKKYKWCSTDNFWY
jgi:hypothetical protein